MPRLNRLWRLLVTAVLGALVALTAAAPAYAAEDAKLVLVLDSSGSMAERVGGDTKISIAKSALRTVIGRLPAEARVGLRVYGATVENRGDKGACTDSQLVVPIGTGNRQELRDGDQEVPPVRGDTNLLLPGQGRRRSRPRRPTDHRVGVRRRGDLRRRSVRHRGRHRQARHSTSRST